MKKNNDKPPSVGFLLNSPNLYRMAREAFERTKSAVSDTELGQRDVVPAVLLCAATLEAFIFELIEVVRDSPSSTMKQLTSVMNRAESQRLSTPLKYLLAKPIYPGGYYDEGADPFQSFDHLFKLRNEIMHHKLQHIYEKPLPPPSSLIQFLAGRKLIQVKKDTVTAFVYLVGTRAVARWACNVVPAMVESLMKPAGKELGISLRTVFIPQFPRVK